MASPNCGMTVRRITDLEEEKTASTAFLPSAEGSTGKVTLPAGPQPASRKRKNVFDDGEEVTRFRRVRIVAKLKQDLKPDIIVVRHMRVACRINFPASTVQNGNFTVGDLAEKVKQRLGIDDKNRIALVYCGRILSDRLQTCKAEGLKPGSELLSLTSGPATITPIMDEDSDSRADSISEPEVFERQARGTSGPRGWRRATVDVNDTKLATAKSRPGGWYCGHCYSGPISYREPVCWRCNRRRDNWSFE